MTESPSTMTPIIGGMPFLLFLGRLQYLVESSLRVLVTPIIRRSAHEDEPSRFAFDLAGRASSDSVVSFLRFDKSTLGSKNSPHRDKEHESGWNANHHILRALETRFHITSCKAPWRSQKTWLIGVIAVPIATVARSAVEHRSLSVPFQPERATMISSVESGEDVHKESSQSRNKRG